MALNVPSLPSVTPDVGQPDIAAPPAAALVPVRVLPVARLLWLALVLLGGGLTGAGLSAHVADLQSACTEPSCADVGWYLSPDGLRQLRDLGISPRTFAFLVVATEFVAGFAGLAASALIIWRRAHEWMALFTAFFLLTFSLGLLSGITNEAATSGTAWVAVSRLITVCGSISLAVFLYFFPDGRFRPRWLWGVVAAWWAIWLPSDLFPGSALSTRHWPSLLEPLVLLVFFALAIGVQVWRYRRLADSAERRQVKWVVYAVTVLLVAHITLLPLAAVGLGVESGTPGQVAVKGTIFVLFQLIPLSIGIAILRERLWDIDLVINRTLVYGALTLCVIVLYTLVVGGLGVLFAGVGTPLLSFVATALIAVLFGPLRAWLQRRVNRLLYGERDEPYVALARLGQRLEGTLTPDAILPTIVATVREALRLPYAAITLADDPRGEPVAQSGTPAPIRLRLPLVYGSETVGELSLASRTAGEEFSHADVQLLTDLARQVGVAVHAARLTSEMRQMNRELQASRERLITAREEERRRLRRDLHDGLGPQLAGFTLRLDVAKNLLRDDPSAAERILGDLSERTQGLMADIRRLVYALRPPSLDELGLVGALRQHAAGYDSSGLRIAIDAPDTLPPLPAAVEVATFRIVQEALTNVARHAGASNCSVTLGVERDPGIGDVLAIAIRDDGRGIPPGYQPGVGLHSMRERTEELGGSYGIESIPGSGTTIRAQLPLDGARDGSVREKPPAVDAPAVRASTGEPHGTDPHPAR